MGVSESVGETVGETVGVSKSVGTLQIDSWH